MILKKNLNYCKLCKFTITFRFCRKCPICHKDLKEHEVRNILQPVKWHGNVARVLSTPYSNTLIRPIVRPTPDFIRASSLQVLWILTILCDHLFV